MLVIENQMDSNTLAASLDDDGAHRLDFQPISFPENTTKDINAERGAAPNITEFLEDSP